MLAYSTRTADAPSNVWLVSNDGEQKREITASKDEGEEVYCPFWTKDGSKIIVGSELDPPGPPVKKVYRVSMFSLESGERSILLEADARPRVLGTGSGDEVLIAERADPAERGAVSKAARIVAINLTSQARRVTATLENVYFENIHLSRDGRTLAYSARTNDLSTLWTVPVAGGIPRKLLEDKDPKVMISGLAWSPDGSSIFFGKQTRTTLLSMLSN
jgi:Tol biopolymer transport system component